MPTRVPNVVVIGAGFAGLKVCQGLRKTPVNVALFDRNNYHLFQPLLYQVASAALSPADIAFPIRAIFRNQQNINIVLAEVKDIDLGRKVIKTADMEIDYDYLVIATGATHSYFGKGDQWAKYAPGLKRVEDALEIRKRILLAYEEADNELDEASRRAKLTFVVVGGGPTGTELAGALREIAAEKIQEDYRTVVGSTVRVILVEANDRIMKQFDPALSEKAKKTLERMGVEVRNNARVTEIDDEGVCVGDERIPANNVFWAAGVQASPLGKSLGCELDRAGRVKVNPDCSVSGHPEVFVIGDQAALTDAKGVTVPGLAPAAMQMGKYVAKVIRQEVTAHVPVEKRQPFVYFDKGTLATIGKARAIADIRGWKFSGFFAWILWSIVHLMFLVSFRNKLLVMINWFFTYIFDSKGARLITGEFHPRIKHMRDVTPETYNA